MRRMADAQSKVRKPPFPQYRTLPVPGEFYTDGQKLYEIMLVVNGRVTAENCATEWSAEFDLSSVSKWRRVRGVSDGGSDGVA